MRIVSFLALIGLLVALSAGPAAAQDGFRSPDDSIHCLWGDDGPNCEVNWRTNTRPYRPRSCEPMIEGLTYGLARRGRTTIGCNMGDSLRSEAFPVLAYGQARRGNGVTCTMRRDGLRCENSAGRGFVLWRGRETLF